MDATRFRKIKDIFAEAVELPFENRARFLSQKCGDDEHLFAEINSLLEAHDEPENLIEKNALSYNEKLNFAAESLFEKNYSGKQFGNYKILSELGRGGMGAVFLAERADGEFERKVALKIVRQTIFDAETEKLFRRERDILASLNHPNIAQLHDGGISGAGETFLVMEFVEGETLLEYAGKQILSVEEKLKLFLKICSAVSYAHRNLTIHRDLKPANILITKDGEPKLLDFGLAKILDENIADQNQTVTVYRAFTPAYASPEQIFGGKAMTASDIYSLGVVLYELLSGDKPFHFESKSLDEIIHTLKNSDPKPPSAILSLKAEKGNRKLNSDLDNITIKALQREPEGRYRTVEEFAEDIGRHLAGLPITARPATFTYRARKFFRRHKTAVSATAVIILSILTGLVFTLWQANEARRQRDIAEKRFNDVRKLSTSMLFEVTPKIENLSGSTEARELLVKNALEYLDSLANESNSDLNLQAELASAYEKIGDLQGNPNKPNLSDYSGAIASYEKANRIRQNFPPTTENLSLRANNFLQLSAVRYVQNDVKGALDDSAESLEIYENMTAQNDSAELRNEYLEARIDNAQIYADNNQYKTAIPLFEKILTDIKISADKDSRRLKTKAESFYVNALSWDGRQREAEAQTAKISADAEKMLADFPNDAQIRQQVWRTYGLLALIYESVNNRQALEFAGKAVEIAQIAVVADEANTQAKQNLAKSYSRIGICLVLVGRLSAALENFKKSEEILNDLVEKEPKNLTYQKDFARLHLRLGDFFRKSKDLPAALDNYQKSVFYFEKIENSDEKNTLVKRDAAQSLKNVGEIQILLKQNESAKQTFEKAFDILNNLKSQNALGEFDFKMLDEVRKNIQAL